MKKYKVAEIKYFVARSFDPEEVEREINSHAAQGWRLVSCVSTNPHQLLLVFEKEE